MNQPASARQWWEKALAFDPGHEEARQKLQPKNIWKADVF